MDQIIGYIDSYGLLVVVAGLLASMICGLIKIPIVKAVRKKNLGEKATTNRITSICTGIVAVLSVLIIIGYSCLSAHSFAPLKSMSLYSDILLAITFAKIAYMLYEGVGVVSLKKGIHKLFEILMTKLKTKKSSDTENYVEGIQAILVDTLHMPLTDAQKEILKKQLKKFAPNKEELSDEDETKV